MKYTLEQINQLSQADFVAAIGWIFEHSPWVTEQVWAQRPWESVSSLHQAMCQAVQKASDKAKLELIQAHPDLGTRTKMADASLGEQKGAGLDRLSPEEFQKIQRLNQAYVQKFGFPFIFAVKGKSKDDIFASMEARLGNSLEAEFEQALQQIYKIAGFRLADVLGSQS